MRFFLFISILLSFSFAGNSQLFREQLKEKTAAQKDKIDFLDQLFSKTDNKLERTIIVNKKGEIYQKLGLLDSALVQHQLALTMAKSISSSNEEIAISYNKIGIIHIYQGKMDEAIINLEKGLPHFRNPKLKANTFNNIAIANKRKSQPEIALQNYFRALTIFKNEDLKTKIVSTLNNIGALYIEINEQKKAIEYFDKALKIAETNDNLDGVISSKANLANYYRKNNQIDRAITLIKESISHYITIGDYENRIATMNSLALCYGDQKKSKKELTTYFDILEIMDETGYSSAKTVIFINIANVYEIENKYDLAINYYNKAESNERANQSIIYLNNTYKSLAIVHEKNGDLSTSLFFKNKQIKLKDSLNLVKKELKVLELESQYKNNELNKQLSITETKNTSLWSTLLIFLLIIILISAGFYIYFNKYLRKSKTSKSLLTQNQMQEKNLRKLANSLKKKERLIKTMSLKHELLKLPYPTNLSPLTEREQEVLKGLKKGLKDQEIADQLFVSITTVRTHLRNSYAKIDVRNRAEAINFINKFEIFPVKSDSVA